MKNIKKIIEEEIDLYVDKFNLSSSDKVIGVLNELFYLSTDKLMSNIGSVEAQDSKSEIAIESWDTFIDNLSNSIQENGDKWKIGIKNIKLKIITYKYFTKKELIKLDSVESFLRVEIKPYFTALQNFVDLEDFTNKFFQLPSNIIYSLIRYLFLLSPELKKKIVVTKEEVVDNINKLIELRLKVADKIGKISNGYSDLFDIMEVKELYDNGLFFEDNFLNRAINEFVYKLTSHKEAKNKMMEIFSGSLVNDINRQSKESPAYIKHITSIKQETSSEYFTKNGEQIGKKFDNELDIVTNKEYEGYIVDNKSRLKEPNEKITSGKMPWENKDSSSDSTDNTSDGSSSGGSGGSSGFGGGFGGGNIGNADFGGDFAPEGTEGEIDGESGTEEGGEEGEEMPKDEETGLPEDFGTVEDNTENTDNTEEEKK